MSNPDSTAVRVALWRALHKMVDAPPHVLEDEIGLTLVSPPEGWRDRPDMHPEFTKRFRASIVARARFIEDLVIEESKKGLKHYVLLGAGLDTFAQRRPDIGSKLQVFEVEQGETQSWKQRRLIETGHDVPTWLHFVPVNFESGSASWWKDLQSAGFDNTKRSIVASTGVSMYLTKDAIKETLSQMAKLAPGSKFLMTFLLPLEMVDKEDQFGYQKSIEEAKASGTPFISLFSPDEMMKLANEAGFKDVKHLSTSSLTQYFSNRSDGLRPSTGEEFLIATT